MGGDIDTIRLVVEEGGMDVNAKDYKGNTPLHYAARKSSNPEVIKVFVGGWGRS